jgi:carboxyl-terminal processing protease
MKKVTIITILAICWMISLTTGCKKDKPAPPVTKDSTIATIDSLSLEINQFIWSGLSSYYLWTDSVSNLSPIKYSTWTALNNFLIPYTDHEKLFNSLLYTTRDKWSWIVTDYTTLEQEFQGITKSMGFEFGLVLYNSGTDIFGYVKYVLKNSPADNAGLKRGDIFTKVNGNILTMSNYQGLLFSNANSYLLSMATISGNTIAPNNIQHQISAIVIAEDPIFLDTVYNVNGTNIGYLVYNQFVSNYDLELNSIFKKFKDQGVQQIILDLRYNPGGSVQSAKYMASMIYSNNKNNVILQTKYNNALENYLLGQYGASYFVQYFPDSIITGSNPGALINSLNLSKLCVIATGNTASASELVINALKAYIPVSLIGSNTVGKYVASITLYDYNNNGVYDSIAGAKVNAKHKYAMQPIILKIANKNGVSDFYNGFTPDYAISEYDYLGSFLQFGDINEPLLHAAINNVMGYPQAKSATASFYQRVADSREFRPHYNEMYFFPRDLKLDNRSIKKALKGKLSLK